MSDDAQLQRDPPSVGLGLQGGGSHGAFTWGVLDRLLDEVQERRLRFAAISGASAGAMNAALCATGLAIGGPAAAKAKLRKFWEDLSRQGFLSGNRFFYGEPGFFGFNIDWSPIAITLEAMGLIVSPYTNPFYTDPLGPLLQSSFSEADLAALNSDKAAPTFVSAVNVGTNERTIFAQPYLTRDTLRASACLPTEFRSVRIGREFYWDGGYMGNPALNPLVDITKDLLLVLVNPFYRRDVPPITSRAILDRLNEITFNASVVLEVNAIEAVNRALEQAVKEGARPEAMRYKPVRFHAIRDDKFMATLGFVSKNSTSWTLIETLFREGWRTADEWLERNYHKLERESSVDAHQDLIGPVLKGLRADR